MTSHSPARLMLRSFITWRYCRYCAVTSAMGMFQMSISSRLIRCRRRSRGPSKPSSRRVRAKESPAPVSGAGTSSVVIAHVHRAAHITHNPFSDFPRMGTPALQDVPYFAPPRFPSQPSFVDGLGELNQVGGKHSLAIDTAQGRSTAPPIDFVVLLRRCKDLVVVVNIAHVRIPRNRPVRAGGIRNHHSRLAADLLG